MRLDYLANKPEFVPILANFYFKEWGQIESERTLDSEIENIQGYLNTEEVPLILIATDKDELLGAAQLKFREMSIYPDKEYWLGGVYVSENHRGKGIAKQMIQELISIAGKLNIKKLYLQTESLDGGLYRQMGWKPIEKVKYKNSDVLVMQRGV